MLLADFIGKEKRAKMILHQEKIMVQTNKVLFFFSSRQYDYFICHDNYDDYYYYC